MSLTKALAIAVCCSTATLGSVVSAADFADPTWPCVQRKVERLSVGLMWPYPIPESASVESADQDAARQLADKLAVRRLTIEELTPDVIAFGSDHAGDTALLGLVFKDVFDSLSTRRSRIINGIGDFSLSQIALTEKIEAARLAMDSEMAKEAPDFDQVDTLEEQLDWDQTIYTDRQQSITYLCESPVLLEKRLYSIAQLLAAQVTE